MTPERWERIKKVFEAALERPPDQRAAFLAEVCAGDDHLRTELESLLSSYEEAGSFIEMPALAAAAESLGEEPGAFEARQRIGPYKLIREIGHGGMGEVYLAVRADEQFQKRVALKLIRHGMNNRDILRRFRQERQILASLDHPNISRLLDGGTSEDGLPYFVMEYIEGLPITDYCDHHKLNTTERLKLFRQVAAAVEYAHQNLVVHRDLKPSNMLVTAEGVVKLLDFGIAKLLNPELSGQTIEPTATALRLMTPEYASPEQVRGESITTASDVYSLGVVLYELLTGHRPFRLKSRAPHEILQIVCEEEPVRPSTAVTRVEVETGSDGTVRATLTPESVSRTREGQPEKLRRRLKGDLDNIVLMALRKEPQRRYTTVNQLSEELRRHLEGEPVAARQSTFGYRAAKLIKRNKIAVTAAALISLTLLGGIVATWWQARVANRERARAERRFNDVRKLANSFLFEVHDAIEKLPGSTPARQLVVNRALEYLNNLSSESWDEVSLQLEIATAYRRIGDVQGNPNTGNLGNTAGALESYRKSLAICAKLKDAYPANAEVYRYLAASHVGIADILVVTGKLSEAVENYRQALTLNEELFAANPGDAHLWIALMRNHLKLGDSWGNPNFPNLGEREKALEHFRRVLEIAARVSVAEPANAQLRSYFYLAHERIGDLEALAGDIDGALASYQQSEEVTQKLLDRDPSNVYYRRHLAVLYQKLSNLLLKQRKDVIGAREHARQAFKIVSALAKYAPTDADMQSMLAVSYERLGDVQDYSGDLAGAIEYYRKYLQTCEALYTADPMNRRWESWVYWASGKLAAALARAGKSEEVTRLRLQMLRIRKARADAREATAVELNDYAWDLLTIEPSRLRDPASALLYAKRAVELSQGNDPAILDTLAWAYHSTGDQAQAIMTEERALALLAPDAPLRREFEANLARFKTAAQGKRPR